MIRCERIIGRLDEAIELMPIELANSNTAFIPEEA
jgi:hypothetical protein